MKETEESAISEGIRMITFALEVDKDAGDDRIKLDPGTRRAFDEARIGLESIFDAQEQKLNKRANRIKELRQASKDMRVQQTFWDFKGRAKGLDENGRLIATERSDKALDEAIGNGPGVDPEDGTQGKLDESGEKPNPWKVPSNGKTPEVPENVKAGLIQALQDGAGRKKACELVGEHLGIAFFTVEEHFDKLVKRGVITKRGKNWVADESDAPPAPDSADPDVLATSETPGQGLIATTEPADAQAA